MNEHDLAIGILEAAGIIGLCLLGAVAIAACLLGGRRERQLAVRCATQPECSDCVAKDLEIEAPRELLRRRPAPNLLPADPQEPAEVPVATAQDKLDQLLMSGAEDGVIPPWDRMQVDWGWDEMPPVRTTMEPSHAR